MKNATPPDRPIRLFSPVWALLCLAFWLPGLPLSAAGDATVSGQLVANGETIALPHVYVWAEDEGFYDPSDPTWTVLFLESPVDERELDGFFFDSAWVRLGITETTEFGDEPELQVFSQSLKLSADSGGNISGGDDPELEIESTGPDRFAGRVHLPAPQDFFDDTFQYDLTFSAPLSNPDAPIGEPLPADGGEPGKAYLAWVEALHSGDPERLAPLVPEDMAAQLHDEGAREELEFLAAMTPTEVTILGGSSDGETAVLQIEGVMEGETLRGEITLVKTGASWMPTKTSW